MSKVSRTKSIFGGPLSTRELCKAAVQNGKCSVSAKSSATPLVKLPQRTPVKKLGTGRKPRLTPTSHQRGQIPRTKPPPPQKTKSRPLASLLGVKKDVQRRPPVKEGVSQKNGVKRKIETELSNKEKTLKTRRVASGGGLFSRMRREAGVIHPARGSQTRHGSLQLPSSRFAEEEELDEFIDDRDANDQWRSELRKVTNYDPTKFKDDGRDDKSMEVSLRQCWREEQRTTRLGRLEDQKELEREAKRRKLRSR
eukprot:g3050.t1